MMTSSRKIPVLRPLYLQQRLLGNKNVPTTYLKFNVSERYCTFLVHVWPVYLWPVGIPEQMEENSSNSASVSKEQKTKTLPHLCKSKYSEILRIWGVLEFIISLPCIGMD